MKSFEYFLIDQGFSALTASHLSTLLLVLIFGFASYIVYIVNKMLLLQLIYKYLKENNLKWLGIITDNKVLFRLAHLLSGVISYGILNIFQFEQVWLQKLIFLYIIISGIYFLDSLLNAVNQIYSTFSVSKSKPIKGYIQVIKIIIYIIGVIFIISELVGTSPFILLSSIGALTAIILIVFKDSLLGLVASIQLSSYDMVAIGDWVEMPKYGADGNVVDISLNTVKVQNFDKTITTIPTYALISDSFKNWRGMVESGGRRIKRAINIDTTSISFCTSEMIERFKEIDYLTDYMDAKLHEIEDYNKLHSKNPEELTNGRRLTNIGTFRAYIVNYLKHHPKIHQNMVQVVRQLPSTENGLPLEIYVFTNDTDWVAYEEIQSDIFDHIIAVVPQFGLRLFQQPAGHDFRKGFQKSE